MFTPIADLTTTEVEREIAAAQGWVAADLDAGAFLVHVPTPSFHLLFLPAAPWPGGTLAALQADTGFFYRRVIMTDDLTGAMTEAGQVLVNWQRWTGETRP
jgi:hypothetical protein